LVKKLGLTTSAHPKPYHLEWFNNSGNAKVTRSARIHFFIGSYHDYADFDVVPMQACSRLLGRPWEYDTDALHHGRTNTYTLMYKGKKIVLLPLTPAAIMKHDKELAKISKNDHALDLPVATSQEIKLKEVIYLLRHLLMLKIMLMQHHAVPCFANMFHFHMILLLCLANCVLLSLTFCRSLMVAWSRG
jgi:hypothetical protein